MQRSTQARLANANANAKANAKKGSRQDLAGPGPFFWLSSVLAAWQRNGLKRGDRKDGSQVPGPWLVPGPCTLALVPSYRRAGNVVEVTGLSSAAGCDSSSGQKGGLRGGAAAGRVGGTGTLGGTGYSSRARDGCRYRYAHRYEHRHEVLLMAAANGSCLVLAEKEGASLFLVEP